MRDASLRGRATPLTAGGAPLPTYLFRRHPPTCPCHTQTHTPRLRAVSHGAPSTASYRPRGQHRAPAARRLPPARRSTRHLCQSSGCALIGSCRAKLELWRRCSAPICSGCRGLLSPRLVRRSETAPEIDPPAISGAATGGAGSAGIEGPLAGISGESTGPW